MFNRLIVQGYRRLKSVDVELRPLTVLVGANGVGKTSLLEVFSLLAASARGGLQDKLAELGGIGEVVTRDWQEILQFALDMPMPDEEHLVYFVHLAPLARSYLIAAEGLHHVGRQAAQSFQHIDLRGTDIRYFSAQDRKLLRPTWELNPFETALSQVPKMYQEPENFRQRLASCALYGALDVSPRSPVRLPQSMNLAPLPGANGESLVSCLYYLRETDTKRFDLIEDTLAAAFPDFEKLSFPPVAAGTLSLSWKDRHFDSPFYSHQLSEGTLRFLWLATLLLSGNLPAVTMIDEPEVSLHPELLRLLVDLLREAAQSSQVIVATHSDRLVRFLQPEEVLVCDMADDGTASMTWADTFDLEKWLADYSLDELWAMNRLGGRP